MSYGGHIMIIGGLPMKLINEFVSNYGMTILYSVITAIIGYIGVALKNLYAGYINDKTKKDVVKTCVGAVEQLYKDLHGAEKFNKCVESAISMLNAKGIDITELELRMLIEATVGKLNEVFVEIPLGVDVDEEAGD